MRQKYLWGFFPAAIVAVLTACGGGGGADAPAPVTQSNAIVATGSITGFGSVHVNGEHFDTTSSQFSIDGSAGRQDDLRVGQRIHVRGHRDSAGRPVADRIEFHSEVRGPIQSIDLAANSLVVLGQSVVVDADTSFDVQITGSTLAGLAAGTSIEVSGVRRADGSIQATRIDLDNGQPKVRGPVASLDATAKKFKIANLTVDYSTATLKGFGTSSPQNGDLVEAEGGSVNVAGELVASEVEKENRDDGARGEDSEVEGPITRFVSATDFDVAGRKTTTTGTTVYEGGVASDLALNVKVEVEGSVDANDVLVASKVQFKRRGDARLAGRVDSVNPTAGTLVVLGVDVTVNSATRLEDKGDQRVTMFNISSLAAGDYVELRGTEVADNDLVATRLERRRAQNEVRVRGVVDTAAQPAFSVLGINVQVTAGTSFEDGSAADFFTGLVGRTVSVKGTMANGVLTAREVEFEDHDD